MRRACLPGLCYNTALPSHGSQYMSIRTRFAPSPTGDLHIGGVRTALFSYLYARRHGGAFVLRIEDTDRERSTPEAVEVILDGMRWLGLTEDEGPFYQSQRGERYGDVLEQLEKSGHAYKCYCTREELEALRESQRAAKQTTRYDGRCRARTEPREGVEPVIRFPNPDEGAVVFDDLVQGSIAVSNAELDDLIIARSDGSPTYNFTVVVDDIDMRISHVIRGDDHINNTPKQINIMRALDFEPPAYAHVPMILGPDGAKLSKRHGAASVLAYRDEGFLPEAVLNYLVRLGWSHGDQEIFSLEEMTALFDINDVNKAASALNPEKLEWLNQHYIKTLPPQALADALAQQFERADIDAAAGPALVDIVELYRERAKTLKDLAEAARWLYQDVDTYDPKGARKHLKPQAVPVMRTLLSSLQGLDSWDGAAIEQCIETCMAEHEVKMGAVAQPVRLAVTGGTFSPPMGVTLVTLGRDKTLARIEQVIAWIDANVADTAS